MSMWINFHNGRAETMTFNIITENLLAQMVEEWRRQLLFDEITDHWILQDDVTK